MPTFAYKAHDPTQRVTAGTLVADTPAEGRARLREQGLQVVQFRPAVSRERRRGRVRGGARQREQVAEVSRHLSLLLRSGVPLVEALAVLVPAPDWAATRAALNEWEQAARSVTGLRTGQSVRVDKTTTAAYWERILGALQQDAGVRFDLTPPRPENAADQFLSAGLATRRVSPATLPLLLAALGQRLQESVELVVAGERLLARATLLTGAQVTLDLDSGGLHTPDEKQVAASQHIPIKAVEAGSDLTPLTPRQLGAWLLARRARVLRYRGNFKGAERDLLLARQIFPVNRAMFLQLVQLLDRRGPRVLGDTAWDIYQSKERQRMALAGANRVPTTPEQVMQFNRMRSSEFGVRNEPFGIPSSIPHSAFRIPPAPNARRSSCSAKRSRS